MQLLQHGEDLQGVENEHFCCGDQSDDELLDNHGDSDGCDEHDNLDL